MAQQEDRPRAAAVRPPGRDARFERRFWWALALAAAIHAGAALVIHLEKAAPPPARLEPLNVLEVSLLEAPEVVPERSQQAPILAEPQNPPAAERTAIERAAPAARSDGIAEPMLPPETAEVAPDPAAVPPSPSNTSPGPAAPGRALSLDAIGLGNSNPFLGMKDLGGSEGAPVPAPAPSTEMPNRTRVAEQRLKQYFIAGALAQDVAVGATRGGVVLSVLRDAAIQLPSPVNGEAEFVATVDASGLVTALFPTRVSSDLAAWRKVAARALTQLAAKRLRVPTGAAGLEVRLALSSKIQQPSGSASGPALNRIPLISADGKRLSRLDLPPESAKLPNANDPGALGTPLMQQAIPGLGAHGDLADIGGIGQRVVRVTITDERPL